VTASRFQEPVEVLEAATETDADTRPVSALERMLSIDRDAVRRKLIPWAMKGGLAFLDQGVFAGSNFVMSVLLARWLPAEQYGAYAVAFSVFLFLLTFHQSLLLEPMLVFGSGVYRNGLRGYMRALLIAHSVMSLVFFIGLLVGAGVTAKLGQGNGLPGALVGVAFMTPTVLLFWLAKRTFYLKLSPAPSAAAAVLYCILTMGGLALVYKYNHELSALTVFLLMAFGGLGSSLVLLAYLHKHLPHTEDGPTVGDAWRRHWRYGRWALGANAMMWIPINAFYPLLSKFSGLAQAGELKALMNFAAPMLQACAALHTLMIPYASRVLSTRGNSGVNVLLKRMTLLCVACAVPYWIVLLLFQGPAFRALYSGRYTEVAYLMPIVGMASIAGSAFFGPSIVLRSLEAPGLIFGAVTISSVVSVVVGIPLMRFWGVSGAVWSIVLSETLAFVAAVILLRRKARQTSEAAPVLAAAAAGE
jgi:O-antigen/teichoic acid export membrane protein